MRLIAPTRFRLILIALLILAPLAVRSYSSLKAWRETQNAIRSAEAANAGLNEELGVLRERIKVLKEYEQRPRKPAPLRR